MKVWVVIHQHYEDVEGVRVFDTKREAKRWAEARNISDYNIREASVESRFPERFYKVYTVNWTPFETLPGADRRRFFSESIGNVMYNPEKGEQKPNPSDGILLATFEEKIVKNGTGLYHDCDRSRVVVQSLISLEHAQKTAIELVKEKTGKDVILPGEKPRNDAVPMTIEGWRTFTNAS